MFKYSGHVSVSVDAAVVDVVLGAAWASAAVDLALANKFEEFFEVDRADRFRGSEPLASEDCMVVRNRPRP